MTVPLNIGLSIALGIFVFAAFILALLLISYRRRLALQGQATEHFKQSAAEKTAELVYAHRDEVARFQQEIDSLARFRDVRDAAATADKLRNAARALRESAERAAAELHANAEAQAAAILEVAKDKAAATVEAATREAENIRRSTSLDSKEKRERTQTLLTEASQRAAGIIQEANQRAEQIAGDAYRALKETDGLRQIVIAMENAIKGYGDRYIKPTYSILDELAETYGFDNAGQQLKQVRKNSELMVKSDRAATCKYVEANRRETAIRFVVDAFNGKVDTILARVRSDNVGTLEQQIYDAFALVNYNGQAFREARITQEYLDARSAELKWAAAVQALREREKEEQRRIREQIREEQKAQREIERALKESARDEEALHKALAKVRAEAAQANEAQRATFDAKLADLQAKLQEAEKRNQRALSMAQQTKAGHVYIISNIGSFGEDVFKVGMTRRLEPLDRIRELGDASVPFAFDVHAMIWSEDAPALEYSLHRHFVNGQVNKVNPRKEFFKVPLSVIRQQIDAKGIEAGWTMTAAAAEYRESLAIAKRLQEDPVAAADWLRYQSDYNPADELLSEDELAENAA
jgi:hypothetical protein